MCFRCDLAKALQARSSTAFYTHCYRNGKFVLIFILSSQNCREDSERNSRVHYPTCLGHAPLVQFLPNNVIILNTPTGRYCKHLRMISPLSYVRGYLRGERLLQHMVQSASDWSTRQVFHATFLHKAQVVRYPLYSLVVRLAACLAAWFEHHA